MTFIQQYLEPSKWTRPQKLRERTIAICIHWTGNPGQNARGVIDYWNGREGTYGSAHAVIDFDGTVYNTLPWDEIGYHVGSDKGYSDLAGHIFPPKATTPQSSPNLYTMGIELCTVNWEGEFTPETVKSCVKLVAKLCRDYNRNPFVNVLTHQMVVGWKQCPKWYVDHPEDFEDLRWKIMDSM